MEYVVHNIQSLWLPQLPWNQLSASPLELTLYFPFDDLR
jgi:hypothetical protein